VNSPSILIVNDDGIFSDGILALWEAMSEIGDTTVVAPKSEHSGAGHAITISRPLQSEKISLSSGLSGYAVNGTPADSVKFAVSVIMKKKPDILVSGINPGSNVGQSILYSGTVSAAREGTFRGINSIAFSIDGDQNFNYDGAKKVSKTIVNSVLNNRLPKDILLNVTIPNITQELYKGYKITKQGSMRFTDKFEKFDNSRGSSFYWLTAKHEDPDRTNDSDRIAVKNGFISITPIHSVQTDFDFMSELNTWKIA
jgi:5'-nucleotidase